MYKLLLDVSKRPQPFSRYSTKELWTRPHLAQQMLNFHLSQATDLASLRIETVDQIVNWIDEELELAGKRVCDLGCGPGLYTQRFANAGARVTGVDFSECSINYAMQRTKLPVEYILADYLCDELPTGFDLITLIYCDICVLSAQQRAHLLSRIKSMLIPGGKLVFDVARSNGLLIKCPGSKQVDSTLLLVTLRLAPAVLF